MKFKKGDEVIVVKNNVLDSRKVYGCTAEIIELNIGGEQEYLIKVISGKMHPGFTWWVSKEAIELINSSPISKKFKELFE